MAIRQTIKNALKKVVRPIYRKIKQNLEFNYRARPSKEDLERYEKIRNQK